jgi:superfamily I DNA and/or RNA helicase
MEKSRQHLSLRELLESDAEPWVKMLCPILMLNPVTMAKSIPNKSQSIDLILFDEASQIPFSHALPAVFRSAQIAVFGDSQQLSPSTFFLSGSSSRVNLLSESRSALSAANLYHHYRSKHPALIAFSNRFFYEQKLRVLPAKTNPKTDGVFCHFQPNTTYKDGFNLEEAKALVEELCKNIKTIRETESIGICAFSEKQLSVIQKYLVEVPQLARLINEEKIQLSSLEQVQGDEFDVLDISLGYGKTEDGIFSPRLGPINQVGGEKRLNVLFSRARRALHFFHSVQAEDFGFPENAGLQALKNFLLLHQSEAKEVHQSSDSVTVLDPFYQEDGLDHLFVLFRHGALSGLKVKIQFSKDRVLK